MNDTEKSLVTLSKPQPRVSRVRIRNYKSIRECDVPVGPLTLLVGANGTGKSNFLDALAFMSEAVSTTPQQAVDSRNGMSEILLRTPEQATAFSILIDFTVAWGGDSSESENWSYGFEIRQAPDGADPPFEVAWEHARSTRGGRANHFTVDEGSVDRPGANQETNVEPGRLLLPAASSVSKLWLRLSQALRGMRFYNFETSTLRRPQPAVKRAVLGRRGEHLGDVLGDLDVSYPKVKQRVDDYLAAVAPGVVGIDWQLVGRYVTVQMRQRSEGGADSSFGPDAMSDGTVRTAAVLAALFQAPTQHGRVNLVGIEEPETALHPAAAGALYDALTEASEHVQVIAATQSDDLLDRDDIDLDAVLAVANTSGSTVIGPLDAVSRQIVRDGHFTLGALMRANQLSPEPAPGEDSGQVAP